MPTQKVLFEYPTAFEHWLTRFEKGKRKVLKDTLIETAICIPKIELRNASLYYTEIYYENQVRFIEEEYHDKPDGFDPHYARVISFYSELEEDLTKHPVISTSVGALIRHWESKGICRESNSYTYRQIKNNYYLIIP